MKKYAYLVSAMVFSAHAFAVEVVDAKQESKSFDFVVTIASQGAIKERAALQTIDFSQSSTATIPYSLDRKSVVQCASKDGKIEKKDVVFRYSGTIDIKMSADSKSIFSTTWNGVTPYVVDNSEILPPFNALCKHGVTDRGMKDNIQFQFKVDKGVAGHVFELHDTRYEIKARKTTGI